MLVPMLNMFGALRLRHSVVLIESAARCAMASPFGCSAEFEAAIIRRKLEDGAYSSSRRRRYFLATAAMSALVAVLLWNI
jgi:hypothetical protein